jgi:HAD superfamily phosphatase
MKKDKLTAIVVFDIDGVIRDVGNSYRRAIADTVEKFTDGAWRPTMEDLDNLKSEGIWNNDWEASQELTYRYFESQGRSRARTRASRQELSINYDRLVEFFQARYRGKHPEFFDGYIAAEPLLISPSYLQQLSDNQVGWGFFSGATRGSAEYVLKKRLEIADPVLVAMEDAPSKPDPTGLFSAISLIEANKVVDNSDCPVFYLGDTVADMYTVVRAKEVKPERNWIAIGILPPHVQSSPELQANYSQKLKESGASIVFSNVEELTIQDIMTLI